MAKSKIYAKGLKQCPYILSTRVVLMDMEICWHGRGGQGLVTANEILAETAIAAGKYVKAFPEFGPERMGAPIRDSPGSPRSPSGSTARCTSPTS